MQVQFQSPIIAQKLQEREGPSRNLCLSKHFRPLKEQNRIFTLGVGIQPGGIEEPAMSHFYTEIAASKWKNLKEASQLPI